jgi:class 3 adenylate cyclase
VAIAMREVMVDLCAKWRKLGHRMGFGVGISLGYATVGMVGFEGRYDYTANGTVVNLASRLCDQAADQEILISQRAATALEDYATVESAGELTLKGFHAPVDVCRVIDVKETL